MAQQKPVNASPTRIRPGDKVPEYELRHLINYPTSTAHLADFKGRLILLDFWTIGCIPCIEAFPKLIQLQDNFKDQIQIILVDASDSEKKTQDFFNARAKIGKGKMTLPAVCLDSILPRKIFQIKFTPTYAWIDPTGMLRGITTSDEITEENINAILEKQDVSFGDATLVAPDLDYFNPLFGKNADALIFQSTISGYTNAMSVLAMKIEGKHGFIDGVNQTILDLYRFAYRDNLLDPYGHTLVDSRRTILEVKDTSRFYKDGINFKNKTNIFTYQLISPATDSAKLFGMMRADLLRYFGLQATTERRKMKCLVLTADDHDLIAYRGGEAFNHWTVAGEDENYGLVAHMIDFWINISDGAPYFAYPILDETGFSGRMGHIKFDADMLDYKAIDKGLQPYKMHFTVQERVIPVLVIKEPELAVQNTLKIN